MNGSSTMITNVQKAAGECVARRLNGALDGLSVLRLLGGMASEATRQIALHAGAPQALRSLEQAALLAAAGQAQRASAADELRAWQAAPFLDAVLRQRRTRFLLHGAARLLRCVLCAISGWLTTSSHGRFSSCWT